MFDVQAQNFGITIESVFQKPISLREAQPEIFAEKLVALLHSWNLRPTRLELHKRDTLYAYEFNFAVYGESAKIILNSNRFNLSFANGRTQADLQTIGNGSVGFSGCFPLPANSFTTANVYTHACFDPSAKHDEYISRFGFAGVNVGLSGAVAHLMTKDWTEPIRFQIDRSETFQSSLFLTWRTKLKNWPITLEVLSGIRKSTDEINEKFLLKFGPLAAV